MQGNVNLSAVDNSSRGTVMISAGSKHCLARFRKLTKGFR